MIKNTLVHRGLVNCKQQYLSKFDLMSIVVCYVLVKVYTNIKYLTLAIHTKLCKKTCNDVDSVFKNHRGL